ncbi:MAG: maleylpyruvate isomerase family mycothiol-dependent enzyme [Actinomycetota bacterium]
MTLSHERYLEAIERESAALAEAARGNLDARVPSCPEWSMRNLVGHIGRVQRFWGEMAERALQDPADAHNHDPPEGVDLVQWFEESTMTLLHTLDGADLDRPMWSWSPIKSVSFVPRRMAQETAMHRWDAENAAGDPADIADDLAVDGIDELLFVFLLAEAPFKEAPGSSVHIHTTNSAGEWLVILDEEPVVTREHAKGDVALRGPSSDLLLHLWGRIEPSSLEIHGDPAALDRFRSVLDLE